MAREVRLSGCNYLFRKGKRFLVRIFKYMNILRFWVTLLASDRQTRLPAGNIECSSRSALSGVPPRLTFSVSRTGRRPSPGCAGSSGSSHRPWRHSKTGETLAALMPVMRAEPDRAIQGRPRVGRLERQCVLRAGGDATRAADAAFLARKVPAATSIQSTGLTSRQVMQFVSSRRRAMQAAGSRRTRPSASPATLASAVRAGIVAVMPRSFGYHGVA
jgi:hypothetical protein